MSKLLIVVGVALASGLGVSGCGSRGETVGGAAAGGVIGHEVGQRYEERNRK
jgi:hypothetical protein